VSGYSFGVGVNFGVSYLKLLLKVADLILLVLDDPSVVVIPHHEVGGNATVVLLAVRWGQQNGLP
jgi:hypothetical protein